MSRTMNGATGDRDWLQRYLFESVRKNLCTRIRCTTCGAGEFRNGLLYAAARAIGEERFEGLDQTNALVIVRALGRVHPVPHLERQTEEAIRLVLFNIWTVLGEAAMARKFEPLLAGIVQETDERLNLPVTIVDQRLVPEPFLHAGLGLGRIIGERARSVALPEHVGHFRARLQHS